MKIAAVSEDGVTVAQHFGRAPDYVVVTVEDGRVVGCETRPRVGHREFAGAGAVDPDRTVGRDRPESTLNEARKGEKCESW